jgi:hypothetical protein
LCALLAVVNILSFTFLAHAISYVCALIAGVLCKLLPAYIDN